MRYTVYASIAADNTSEPFLPSVKGRSQKTDFLGTRIHLHNSTSIGRNAYLTRKFAIVSSTKKRETPVAC